MTEHSHESQLIKRLTALPKGRHIVAIVGAPASGKSTLAERLSAHLNAARPGRCAVLPMDGYHYDDQVLEARGQRARKGAPHTFDVAGLRHILQRLRACDEPEVAIPVFDRRIEMARAGAQILPQSLEIILVEGNYLLLNQSPWDTLHGLFDLTVSLNVPEALLRQRLTQRWIHYDLTHAQIASKLEDNDLPNGRLVRSSSIAADLVLEIRA